MPETLVLAYAQKVLFRPTTTTAPLKGVNDVGRTHHPKPQIVVAVVRRVVVAVSGARIVLKNVPGAAAHNPAVRCQRAPPAKTGRFIIPQLSGKRKNRRGALLALIPLTRQSVSSVDGGRTHHPKPKTVVAVVRREVEAESGARIALINVPGAAAHNPAGIALRVFPAVIGIVGIVLIRASSPFPDIAGHIFQAFRCITARKYTNGYRCPDMAFKRIGQLHIKSIAVGITTPCKSSRRSFRWVGEMINRFER